MKSRKFRGTKCLNCLTPLDVSDRYCSFCGQENSTKKLSFNDFFNEFFAGIFAYDSRLYRTLTALLFRPGKISKDYISGKRQRYANPYKFYLSASIIFFILWSFANNISIKKETTALPAHAEALSEEKIDSILTHQPTEEFSTLDLFDNEKSWKEVYLPEETLTKLSFWDATDKKIEIFYKLYEKNRIKDASMALTILNYTPTGYNLWLYKKIVDIHFFATNPEMFVSYFIAKLPFIIFFCLPIFALFIWLLYFRKSYTYMEHLIFIFHNQSLLFLLLIFTTILGFIFEGSEFSSIAILVFLFSLYKGMRRFYGQSRFKTIVKFLILNGIFIILATFAGIFALLASFAIY